MINSFNTNIAKEIGVNAALFIQHIAQWTFKNLANKRHVHEGHAWTYDTLSALNKIFPYWTKSQLETSINNAIKEGFIVKGNFNKHRYDQTCWYALAYKTYEYYTEFQDWDFAETLYSSISEKSEMYFGDFGTAVLKIRTPIPTNNTTKVSKDTNPADAECAGNSKSFSKSGVYRKEEILANNPHSIPEELIDDWISIRKQKKAKITQSAWNKMNKNMQEIKAEFNISPKSAFETMVMNCWLAVDAKYFKRNESNNKPRMNGHDDRETMWNV